MKSILLCCAALAFQGQQATALADSVPASATTSPQILMEAAVFESPLPAAKNGSREQPAEMSAERCLKKSSLWSTNFIYVSPTNTVGPDGSGFDYVAGMGNSFATTIAALCCDSAKLQIIQKPRIVTRPGVPGHFFVGNCHLYVAGSTWGAPAPEPDPLPKEILELKVTPSLLTNGLFTLEIQSEDSWIVENTNRISGESIRCPKLIQSRVPVTTHGGEILMLVGETKTYPQKRSSGVPVLKHIPLIGAWFRGSSSDSQRTRIIVLLKTSVLPGS